MANTSKEDIRKKFERDLETYKWKIQAWKQVELVTKKDGTPFQSFGKNFTRCNVKKEWDDVKLEVSGWVGCNGRNDWVSDEVNTRINLSYYDGRYGKPSEDRIIKVAGLCPFFYLTPSETYKLIKDHIKCLEKYKKELEDALDKLDTAYDTVEKKLNELHETIKTISGGDRTSLYYALREKVNNFPY